MNITQVRKQLPELVERLQEAPVVLTRLGVPVAVLVGWEEWRKDQDAIQVAD